MEDRKILSVGGSIIIPKTGFNIEFLKEFREMILKFVADGQQFIMVVGGGATCRTYQQAAADVRQLTDEDLDWVGIHTTIFNANFVRMLFKEQAYEEVIRNPNEKVATDKPIIIGAGYEPGHSTDTDAVLLAKTYGAKHVLNLSNISHVYDKDPAKFEDAKKIEKIDWATFRKDIVGEVWTPGFNAPFDPNASRIAQEEGMQVSVLDGTNLEGVRKAISGESFEGTHIS